MNNDTVKVEERHLTNDEFDRRRTLCVTKRKPALRPPFGLSKPSQRHDPHHHFDKSHGRLDVSSRKRHSEPLRQHWPQDEKSHPVALSQPTVGVERSLSGEAEDEDGNNDQTRLEIEVLPPSPIALLGPGEGDPFFVLPSDLPRKFIDERLYSARSIIADMVSRGPSGEVYGKAVAASIMSSITSSPALFYAMMVGESMYSRAQKRNPRSSSIELEVGARAVQYLSQEMRDPVRAVSDANIWAVLTLGYSGKIAPSRVGPKYPRQSFLKELQSIHIYCRMEIVYAHVLGLMKLVELLGGIHNIKTPGMAQVLSLCGIIGACVTVQPPLYPFVGHTDSFMVQRRLSVYDEERMSTQSTLGSLGSGFLIAWESSIFTDMDQFKMVLQHICDFTIIVENYVQGRWMPRTFVTIIDQRNFVQHSLMSLRSRQARPDMGEMHGDPAYESCRLAVIIYSFLVVFPLPPIIGPLETLTERLQYEISAAPGFKDRKQSTQNLHLWILTMGAIAAIGLPQRSWFLSAMQELMTDMGIQEWEEMRSILMSFLWHPMTNDPDGEDILSEMQNV